MHSLQAIRRRTFSIRTDVYGKARRVTVGCGSRPQKKAAHCGRGGVQGRQGRESAGEPFKQGGRQRLHRCALPMMILRHPAGMRFLLCTAVSKTQGARARNEAPVLIRR
jgi:hypothetical protein